MIIDLAGGRDVEAFEWKAKKAWHLKSRVRFCQDTLECGGITMGCCKLRKIHVPSGRGLPLQKLVLVVDPRKVWVGRRPGDF